MNVIFYNNTMYTPETLLEIKRNVINELDKAKARQPSSFPFIRHSLSQKSLIQGDEIFQVLVIGGTFFRTALLKQTNGTLTIIKDNTGPLPVFDTGAQFLKFVEQHIDRSITYLALNFAYPLTPIMRHNILDGILQSGSKENQFQGMIDKTIGRLIEEHIEHTWNKNIHVAVANDTTCLLLSGLTITSWNLLAAGIVGTGLNFAFFLDKQTAVNLEAAEFNTFPQSMEGYEIDQKSTVPGAALYEKEVSGVYLYKHFNIHIKKNNLQYEPINSTEELDLKARANIPEISSLAQSYLDHSAALVAAQVAGIMEFCKRDLTFIMQGSLYWKGNLYAETVKKTVQSLSSDYKADYVNIINSDVLGAAKLIS